MSTDQTNAIARRLRKPACMEKQITHPLLQVLVLAFLIFASPFALSPALAQEGSLTWTADDPQLEWGNCPEFMPEGCEIAVLQGDPTQSNTDIFFKMTPNTTIPAHWHTSAERMVLVSGKMHVDYEGHEPVVLQPGTYAYGPPELPHEAQCAEGDDCVLFIAFEEPVDAFAVEAPE